jgi:hypothetical protein
MPQKTSELFDIQVSSEEGIVKSLTWIRKSVLPEKKIQKIESPDNRDD